MSGPVRDVKDFWFKQLRKVEFGDPGVPGDARVSLLACSSLHGLTFVATRIGLCVFETAVLDEVNKTAGGPQSSHVDASLLKAKEFRTPSLPLHLSLSCDSLTLCLAWRDDSRISLNFFDVRAVVQATSSSLQPFCSIVPNTMQGAGLCGLKWNPTSPDLLAVSLSSGGVYVLEVKEDVKVLASKTDMGATSLCWSPKGKQLALGLKNGSVVQYNHKTSTQKCHACPDAFGGEPQQVADLHWVSTFLFAVVFTPVSGSGAPSSLFLSTPKDGPVAWTNFEDVYYGGSNRSYHFYFTYLSPWNLMMTSSANSMETVVFSQFGSGGADWEQWELDDTGRAEIPLKDGEDTHVAGMGLSLCSTCDVQIDDNLAIPPSPLLLLYSTAGVLCPFWLVHRDQQAAVVTPPTPLPSGPPRLATQPQLQSVAPGTQFTAGAILASSAAPVSSQTLPATPAPTTAFPQQAQSTPFGQTVFRLPPPASGQTPITSSVRPPPPASTIAFSQTPTTGSVRPPAPAGTTPFGQTPTTGSIRPPAPASTTPFGQTATIGSIRPPAPAGTIPFGQTPTTGSIRLPAPASTTPLGPSDTSKRSSLGVTVRPVHPTSQQQPVSAPGTVRPPQPTAHQTLPPVSVTTSAVPHLSPPPLPPSSKASASVRQSKDDSRQLEATFSAHIREEIDRFVMELEDFKESVEGVLGEGWEEGERERGEVAGLGSVRDAVEVREEEEEVERDVQAAVNCVKELAETCDQLRDEVLRGLELSEKARVSVRRRGDMEHALRQKVRPLDPTNTKKLNDIRELFLRVDQKTGEVNGQLDAEIQKRRMDSLRGGRSVLRPPSIQTVYASLRDHNKIIKLQEERAAQVVRDVKRLRFIPMSWTPDQCRLPPPAMPTQRLTEQGGHGGEGRKDGGPQPEKLEKLREYLMNIEKTPVRRVGARPLPSATPSVLSVQSSGRSSPASSIPHYLVSGSKPHLYEKTRSSLAHVSALTPQDSSTYLDSQPTPETSRSPPPSPSPHPPSLSPQSIAPASLPPPYFAPPPSVSFSSGNTISWGVPTTAGGGVVSSGLSGAEGQVNLSSTSKPGDSGSGVVMPFPLSLLSSSSHPPPSSRPVISAQTPAGRSPFASTPLTSQTVAPSLFKPSLAHSPKETALLLGYSGQPSTKPQGTVFSLGSPGQPSTKPFPSSATGGGPVSFSSPFVFGATSQSSILSLSQVAGGPTFSPSTTSSSQLNQSVGSSVSPNPLPSVVSFSQTGVGSSRSSGIGTPTTVTLPAQSFALGFNTSHAVVSTSPSLATLASSKPPVSTVVSSAPPVSTVVSSAPPVSTVVSSAPPVSTVVSSTPPVSTVVSSTTPVSTVVSSKQPLTVTKLPLLSGTPSVPPTVSSTPSQTGVMSTAPLPAGDGDSTPQTTTLTLTNASTTPSVARAVPPATVTSVSLPSGHPQTSTGTDEIEDDMDQADVVSQSLAPVSSVGGGGFFGGLGSLGLGGTPRSSTTANPFGSFTSGVDSTTRVSSAQLFSGTGGLVTSTGVLGGSPIGGLGIGSPGGSGKAPFTLGSQPQFGQGPKFGQGSVFGGGGPSLGGPSLNLGGRFASAAARMEDISFGALAGQGSGGFGSHQDLGFSSGPSFPPSSMSGSSFSGWRQ